MKRLRAAVIFAALAMTPVAFAQHHHGEPAGGGADETGSTESHEDESSRVENWWSFDFGPHASSPERARLPPPFGWAFVNFAVFAFIISRILWKPLKAGWEQKHDQIKGELAEATKLRKDAEAQLAEYTRKVSHVDEEVARLFAQLRREAEADRARIIEAAEAEAQRVKVEADRQIQVEIERARAELRQETVAAALRAAEEILKTRINADDQKRLAEQYVASVEARTVGGRS